MEDEKLKRINEIENELTVHNHSWALEQMLLGKTVGSSFGSSASRWKLVGDEIWTRSRLSTDFKNTHWSVDYWRNRCPVWDSGFMETFHTEEEE